MSTSWNTSSTTHTSVSTESVQAHHDRGHCVFRTASIYTFSRISGTEGSELSPLEYDWIRVERSFDSDAARVRQGWSVAEESGRLCAWLRPHPSVTCTTSTTGTEFIILLPRHKARVLKTEPSTSCQTHRPQPLSSHGAPLANITTHLTRSQGGKPAESSTRKGSTRQFHQLLT